MNTSTKQSLYAIVIPSVLLVILYLTISSINFKQIDKTCVVMSATTCVTVSGDEVKNINLKSYDLDSLSYKKGEEVKYLSETPEEQKKDWILYAFIGCIILSLLIRFPYFFFRLFGSVGDIID